MPWIFTKPLTRFAALLRLQAWWDGPLIQLGTKCQEAFSLHARTGHGVHEPRDGGALGHAAGGRQGVRRKDQTKGQQVRGFKFLCMTLCWTCMGVAAAKGTSFKSAMEERNWRSTTEVQMSMPHLGCLRAQIFMASPRRTVRLCALFA